MDEVKRKELLAKRKYYREHPEEAKRDYFKRDDGFGARVVDTDKDKPIKN